MDNKIQIIDQRLAGLCSLISQCRAQSAAAVKRLAYTIITLEIKRIEAIHALENRLGKLRALIPVYKARYPTYEHVLAMQIINLDLQLFAAKTKQYLPHPFAAHPFALHPPATNLHTPQPLQSDDMAGIFTQRPRQLPNIYRQPGQVISAPINNF